MSFLGRSEVTARLAEDEVSVPHATPSSVFPFPEPLLEPVFGLGFDRKDFFDVALGARVRLVDRLVLTLGVFKPLNDDGFRTSGWSPVAALEATF